MGEERQDIVVAHVCYQQTCAHITSLSERVREGEALDEANDFARFVINSGLPKLLSPFDNTNGPLRVDSGHLRWMAEELRRLVCARFQAGKVAPRSSTGELQAINHKLDLIAGHLANLSKRTTQSDTSAAGPPALHVLEGTG